MSNSADRLKTASKQEVCQWLIKAQDHLCTHPDMIVKAFKVTGLSLALDGSEDNLFRIQHLLQGIEAGAQDDDIDAEPEDEDPFASDSNSDSDCECDSDFVIIRTDCIGVAVLIRTFPGISCLR